MHASNKKLRNGWMLTKNQRHNNDSMERNVKNFANPPALKLAETLAANGPRDKYRNKQKVALAPESLPGTSSGVVACFQRIHIQGPY
ncbi:hypothetical protein [Methylomagnum sp.]